MARVLLIVLALILSVPADAAEPQWMAAFGRATASPSPSPRTSFECVREALARATPKS
jgi:hypothetical protein